MKGTMHEQKEFAVWLLALLLFLITAFSSRGAAAEENPADRVSIGDSIQLLSPPVPRQFGWLCASLAT